VTKCTQKSSGRKTVFRTNYKSQYFDTVPLSVGLETLDSRLVRPPNKLIDKDNNFFYKTWPRKYVYYGTVLHYCFAGLIIADFWDIGGVKVPLYTANIRVQVLL
jgi:hypothetical protein